MLTRDDILYLIHRKPLEKALEVLPPNFTKQQLWLKTEHYRQLSIKTILKSNPSRLEEKWLLEAIATKPLDADIEGMLDEAITTHPNNFSHLEKEARKQQLALREKYQGAA